MSAAERTNGGVYEPVFAIRNPVMIGDTIPAMLPTVL
jgi:hypothetical protein